jgi:hypothetical protein
MKKVCVKCGLEKKLDSFAKGRNYKDGRRGTCKRCHTNYVIDYYNKNPEKKRLKNAMNSGNDANWKRHHIPQEKYLEMLSKYDNKCYACKKRKATNIDHDHDCCPENRSCGKCVRGILCHNCNTALGLMKDSKEDLKKLIEYL